MRAIGDPLFLKQTYGKGYQVGMHVNVEHVEEVKAMVASVLPGSNCLADPITGVVAVGVVKEDLGGLSRLFQWLEHSRRAKLAVREWGISNTTLEQVFLMLCVQNTEVNYVDPGRLDNQNQHALCPMCRTQFRSAVIVRVWSPVPADAHEADGDVEMQSSPLIALADSVCPDCARGNKHYFVSEAQALEASSDPTGAKMASLIEAAHVQAEVAKSNAMLAAFEAEESKDERGHEEDHEEPPSSESENLLSSASQSSVSNVPLTMAAVLSPYRSTVQGTAVSQVGHFRIIANLVQRIKLFPIIFCLRVG